MAMWIEWTLGHNECCCAPSPRSFPTCDLCERNTFAKHKHRGWDDNACLGTCSIGAWHNSLDRRPSWYLVSPLLQNKTIASCQLWKRRGAEEQHMYGKSVSVCSAEKYTKHCSNTLLGILSCRTDVMKYELCPPGCWVWPNLLFKILNKSSCTKNHWVSLHVACTHT